MFHNIFSCCNDVSACCAAIAELIQYFCLLSSVLTPYYNEDVLYSDEELNKENEDGITTLFYLQKIYPGECVICGLLIAVSHCNTDKALNLVVFI